MSTAHLAAGAGLAVAAACCYDTGYALQAFEARRAPRAQALRASLLATLARRRRWLLAGALIAGGWVLQVAALRLAPLTAVQPLLSLGLLLLLALAVRWLGEHVGRREIAGVLAIGAGTATLVALAPSRSAHHSGGWRLAAVLVPLAVIALLPYALRLLRPEALLLAAGSADAFAALATKFVSDDLHAPVRALAWAVAAGATVALGLLAEMTALQRLPASRVGPTVLALQVALPVLLAPAVTGETWHDVPLGGGSLVLALGAVVSGVVLLAPATSELEHERGRGR